MGITSAIVLYAVIWFMTLFVVLPIGLRTQGDEGEIVRGTPASAPAGGRMPRVFKIVTIVAFPIWLVICGVILSGWITVDDFDLFHRFLATDAPTS